MTKNESIAEGFLKTKKNHLQFSNLQEPSYLLMVPVSGTPYNLLPWYFFWEWGGGDGAAFVAQPLLYLCN